MYFGAPFSDPSSIKSKSITKFRAAIMTMPKESPILNIEELLGLNNEIPEPKKFIIKLIRYSKNIPPVAANKPNLKFSVGFIIFDLYAKSKENNTKTVIEIA